MVHNISNLVLWYNNDFSIGEFDFGSSYEMWNYYVLIRSSVIPTRFRNLVFIKMI